MARIIHQNEINLLWKYLTEDASEAAKRKYVYPLFMKVFGDKFLTESGAARGADGYVEGQLLLELKTSKEDWLAGVFQALHYEKLEPKFSAICVITQGFLGLWKLKNLPVEVLNLAKSASAFDAPNAVGVRNSRTLKREHKGIVKQLLNEATFLFHTSDVNSLFDTSYTQELNAFSQQLKNLDKERLQIRASNFIGFIQRMFKFFEDDLEAIHAFYSFVGYWDITSTMLMPRESEPELVNIVNKYDRQSEYVRVRQSKQEDFKRFIEGHYVHYNDGTGFPVDYYFSRFDEVIAQLKPEYAKQHGIFFTDYHLCKFTRWFIHNYYEKKLHERYILFDPAGGSGNLATSWRGHVQHKIISELQPDLLKTIEKRMLLDDDHRGSFTIIPKTREGVGLNFLDRSAEDYLNIINRELQEKNVLLDKPFAFFLNPPYKNTDENDELRDANEASYDVHTSITDLTGKDAGKERYVAFLAQILNICKQQVQENPEFEPLLMIFTPTSWLVPRATYVPFRDSFDKHFEYQDGYIVTSNEFFKVDGKWPVALTIWKYSYGEERKNKVKLRDYTHIKYEHLKSITFEDSLENIKVLIGPLIKNAEIISYDASRSDIRNDLPAILKNGEKVRQTRYDYSTAKKERDYRQIVSGFPIADEYNHFTLKRKCGDSSGGFVGFMDDLTPVRVKQDTLSRMSNRPDRVWFRLDLDFKGMNKTKVFNGPADNRSYCAYDLPSARATFKWYAMTKVLVGSYPKWANQCDIWSPIIPENLENEFYSLCFAFILSENQCIVTRFEANNPVQGTPPVYVDNPLCPINRDSFWSTCLDSQITSTDAKALVDKVKALYHYWDKNYTRGSVKHDESLAEEAYFKYFSYEPFLTTFSGLIQIKKYAQYHSDTELLNRLQEIDNLKKGVKNKIYTLLVDDFKYFK